MSAVPNQRTVLFGWRTRSLVAALGPTFAHMQRRTWSFKPGQPAPEYINRVRGDARAASGPGGVLTDIQLEQIITDAPQGSKCPSGVTLRSDVLPYLKLAKVGQLNFTKVSKR